MREPLLLFLVAGGLLFALDRALNPADASRVIVVPASVEEEARAGFTESRGRAPTDKEVAVLRQVWIDNEVLYREGLAMQTDKGDETIRQRVIFKEMSIIDAGIQLPPIDEAGLRAWFEQHRDRYDEPVRYTFQEGVPSPEQRNESGIRSFVAMLNDNLRGDVQAELRVFRGRPLANLDDSYGPDFAPALDAMFRAGGEHGQWRAVQSREGWHAIRVEEITPRKPADFEPIKGVVLQDWKDATITQARIDEVRKMGRKYRIEVEPAARSAP